MDMSEISREINRLENSDTNYTNCDKLATLYTVRNGLNPANEEAKASRKIVHSYSYANPSEFISAFNNAEKDKALMILDEHFQTIKALYPREYNAIIKKMNNT